MTKTMNQGWYLAGMLAGSLPLGCASPCMDDGLDQASCPDPIASGGDTGDMDGESQASASAAGSTGASSNDGAGGDHTGADGDSGENVYEPWCVDEDGDGYGDPGDCQDSDEPIPGSVNNDGDCDDTSAFTFPGAAPHDDPEACMKDEDDDDWGDLAPPPDVDPGTDCHDGNAFAHPGAAEIENPALCAEDADEDGWGDIAPPVGVDAGTDCADDNPFAFPGAAELEDPPDLCMLDADDDGWGDASPGEDFASGSDCYDGNAGLNPSAMRLTSFLPQDLDVGMSTTLAIIDPDGAGISATVMLEDPMGEDPGVKISTAAVDEHGKIVANDLDTVKLQSVDYAGVCMTGTSKVEPLGPTYGFPGDILCGLEFGSGGQIYGIGNDDNLLTFDPETGEFLDEVPIKTMGIPLNIHSCDMAYDCAEDRLLVANGINNSIYSVDPSNGVAVNLRDLSGSFGGPWSSVGLEFDPVTHEVYLSVGKVLYRVPIDGPGSHVNIGTAAWTLSNLQYLPVCP